MDASGQVHLPDGRSLDFRVSGPMNGLPLIYHHGTPGSASPIRAIERAAHERGLRLVTTSRPGYGESSRHRHRSVVDVAADISAVLAFLDEERCLIAGWSGGGPHALACAARLEGAAAVLVIAGVAPFEAQGLDWMAGMGEENVVEFGTAIEGERALRAYLDEQREHLGDVNVESILTSLATVLPDVDRAVLSDEYGEDMVLQFREALRMGVDGWLDDDLAFVKPWGFVVDEISIPTMIWQGSADLMVPFAHGHWLATHLRQASVHLEDGEGHESLGLGALNRMFDELIAAGDSK